MKQKIAVIAVLMFLTAGASTVFAAYSGKAGDCCKGMEGKICHKAKMIIDSGEGVGLSEADVEKAKELKMQAKRIAIQMDSGIELAKLDVMEALYQDTAELKRIEALIDAKYALKSEKAKKLAAIYVELKAIPTAEQWKELKQQKKCDRCIKMNQQG